MNPTKIHPTLLEAINLSARSLDEGAYGIEEEDEFPIIVRFQPQALPFSALGVVAEEQGIRVERHIDMLSATVGSATREQIAELSKSGKVAIIWYDEPVYALLDTSVPLLNVPAVWQSGDRGKGIRIAVVDTGVDRFHPDLAGRVIAEQDFTSEGPGDRHGHGTHVASIAAGSGAASNGLYRGVAPEASLIAAKVLRADATGRMSFVMAGVEWAVQQGAQIINLSLGTRGPCDGSDATSAICNAAVQQGAVVIVAAGNDGPGMQTIGSPGCAKDVITVGAVSDDDRVADFSSRGPTLDGRTKPDLVAPGVSVIAARASGTSYSAVVNEMYTRDQGTSMATPHVSGVAALMLAANPALSPYDIKRMMMEATRPLSGDPNLQGTGRLLADRAVELARAALPPTPEPTPAPPPQPQPQPQPQPGPVPLPDAEGCLGSLMALFSRRSS